MADFDPDAFLAKVQPAPATPAAAAAGFDPDAFLAKVPRAAPPIDMGAPARARRAASGMEPAAPAQIYPGTTLNPKQEDSYQAWKKTLPARLQSEGDYDLRGFYQENPHFSVDTPGQHMTDKFKLPNHETFSDESKYYPGNESMGGHWEGGRNGANWAFVPNDPSKKRRIEEDANGNRITAPAPPKPPLSGMRPEPQPDDVTAADVRPDLGKRDVNKIIQGRNSQISTPEASARSKARAEVEDPIKNDPLAGMIVQSLPASGLGVVAGGLTRYIAPGLAPLVQDAITGAASTPDTPLTGAMLGAIPGAPAAAGAAKSAAEKAILARALQQPSAGTVAKLAGKGVTSGIGGAIGGWPGAMLGSQAGDAVANGVNAVGNKAARAMAARQLARAAEGADPALVADVASRMSKSSPAVAPGGRLPVSDADIVSSRAVPAARVRAADIVSNEPAETPALRAQVIRDAQRFRSQPYETEPSYSGYVSPEEALAARPRVLYPNDKGVTLAPSGATSATPWRAASEMAEPPADDLTELLKRSIEEAKRRKAQGR